MNQNRLAIFAASAVLLTSFGASAYDTKVNRLHNVDAKIVAALTKAKLPATKRVREHFAGWPISKIKAYAKRKKLDQTAFLKVVRQCELVEAKPITPQIAHMLTHQCNVNSAGAMRGQSGNTLAPCVAKNAARYGLNPTPQPADIQVWVDAMKATANDTERVNWANKVMIMRFHQKDEKLFKALKKKKWTDNLLVHENLKISGARDKFAKRYRVDADAVRRYAAYADLLRIKTINPAVAHLMFLANIKSIGMLAGQGAPELHKLLDDTNKRHNVIPKAVPLNMVKSLIADAKKFK
jgi:hypothetical protein